MTTATPTPPSQQMGAEPVITLKGVSWQTFKTLLAEIGEDRTCRMAYDQGVLEIRMPLEDHEVPKGILQVYHLVEGQYERREESLAFPFLPVTEVTGFIEQSNTQGQRTAVRLFRQRIRECLQTQ